MCSDNSESSLSRYDNLPATLAPKSGVAGNSANIGASTGANIGAATGISSVTGK